MLRKFLCVLISRSSLILTAKVSRSTVYVCKEQLTLQVFIVPCNNDDFDAVFANCIMRDSTSDDYVMSLASLFYTTALLFEVCSLHKIVPVWM